MVPQRTPQSWGESVGATTACRVSYKLHKDTLGSGDEVEDIQIISLSTTKDFRLLYDNRTILPLQIIFKPAREWSGLQNLIRDLQRLLLDVQTGGVRWQLQHAERHIHLAILPGQLPGKCGLHLPHLASRGKLRELDNHGLGHKLHDLVGFRYI